MSNPKQMGKTMITIAWVGLLVLLSWFFSGGLKTNHHPSSTHHNGTIEVKLSQNAQGHYVSKGYINGHSVTFLIDTGATSIALPAKVARQLGIESTTKITLSTANGNTQGYLSRLESVKIGDIELLDISAVISPNMDDDDVLLGMSFLKHLEFTQRDKLLILRQHTP